MTRDDPGVGDLAELLHDAALQGGDWDPERRQLTLRFKCLRAGEDGRQLDDLVVDVVVTEVSAIAVSYDPGEIEERPSTFRVPERARIRRLIPWPLPAGEHETLGDGDGACDDVDLAATTEWLHGDLDALAGARHRLAIHADSRDPYVRRWITFAFEDAMPQVRGRPISWQAWADQYDAWWRGWSAYWAGERTGGAASARDEASHPAGPDERPRARVRIAEPVLDLDDSDAPSELLAPVLAWFEAQHASDDDLAQLAYARSIVSWWIEGRRANLVVAGVEHIPADEEEPAESIATTWSFALRHHGAGWVVRTWTALDADGPLPAWAARWRSGRVTLR